MSKPAPRSPESIWTAWADRAIARGGPEAARASRFLDNADPKHPDLKGLSPQIRTAHSDRLHKAAKGPRSSSEGPSPER